MCTKQTTYVADAPGDCALLTGSRSLVRLALNTWNEISIHVADLAGKGRCTEVHDVIPADGAVVDHNVPRPQSHGVPLSMESVTCARGRALMSSYLLHLEPLLPISCSIGARALRCLGYGLALRWPGRRGVWHIHVGHFEG